MSAQLMAKIPFTHAGEQFDVWVVRVPAVWEFKVFVRKDDRPVAFRRDGEPFARMVYSVSFESEIDARMVTKFSLVTQAVAAAQADLANLQHVVISSE